MKTGSSGEEERRYQKRYFGGDDLLALAATVDGPPQHRPPRDRNATTASRSTCRLPSASHFQIARERWRSRTRGQTLRKEPRSHASLKPQRFLSTQGAFSAKFNVALSMSLSLFMTSLISGYIRLELTKPDSLDQTLAYVRIPRTILFGSRHYLFATWFWRQ